MGESGDETERYEREKHFHDVAFADERRAGLLGIYKWLPAAGEFYASTVLDLGAGKRVLEYGCGTGGLVFELVANGAQGTAIDISDTAIDLARATAGRRGLDIDFRQMNAEELKFDDQSFDLVFGSGILHHLDLEKSVEEVRRVLAPGGSAVFLEPLGHNVLINGFRRFTPSMRTSDEHPLKAGDLSLLRSLFAESHFRFFDLATLVTLPAIKIAPVQKFVAHDTVVGRALGRFDSWLFERSLLFANHAWVCVMTLKAQGD